MWAWEGLGSHLGPSRFPKGANLTQIPKLAQAPVPTLCGSVCIPSSPAPPHHITPNRGQRRTFNFSILPWKSRAHQLLSYMRFEF